jgi:2-oxoisovalerate dehydrogenase E2 component (dihydrolipoyl transacylase)
VPETKSSKKIEVRMPQLAESVVSATIAKWLKQPGEAVEEYEPICEIITDKVNAEIPCTVSGVMGEILVQEGQTVDVDTIICTIGVEQSASGSITGTLQGETVQQAVSGPTADLGDQSMRHRYSPAVRTLADEHQVDLNEVQGSGHQGRITRKDVLKYIEAGQPKHIAPAAASAPSETTVNEIEEAKESRQNSVRTSGIHLSEYPLNSKIEVEDRTFDGKGEYLIDVTPIRNTIATRMRQSVSEIPHAWTMIEVDLTNLVKLRNKVKDDFKRKEGVNLTYLSFLMKAVVNAIRDYPLMNSVWAVDKIIVKRDINISLAVGTEDSVLTPVIHRADQKNIAGLAREIDELAKKTRAGKLTPNDMVGGTFTINNTGSFGSILSYPIINYPQAAILTFESIVKKPVVIDDMIAVRSMANLCLSLDHRILDGVICGRFLQRVKENLESYHTEMNVY